jgi:hypothetical protein
MATLHPNSQAIPSDAGRRFVAPAARSPVPQPASVLDLLGKDDPLHQEMEHLLAEKKSLSAPPLNGASTATHGVRPTEAADPAEPVPLPEHEELAVLRVENIQLRARVEELEQILEATTDQTEQMWAEQQKEYEMLLEEKSEVIRTLHQELQELREQPAEGEVRPVRRSANEDALQSEVAALKEQLEQQRQQLLEDEQALMDQMRQMEIAMSKERVEMARQRSELQRLHQELQHAIEQAHKDGGLRERLQALQRRAAPEAAPPAGQANPAPGRPAPRRALPTQSALPGANGASSNRPSSGFLRRLFGQ